MVRLTRGTPLKDPSGSRCAPAGNGDIRVTGGLLDVMKESGHALVTGPQVED